MSKKIIRGVVYELDDGTVVRLQKWSISKLYAMLDAISVVLQKIDVKFGKESYSSAEIGQVIAAATKASSAQLTDIILESISKGHKHTEMTVGEWMPEEYFGVLSKILEMNLTQDLVKNLRSLQLAFKPQSKQ